MEDDSELGDGHKTFVGIQLEGGEITLTGHYLADQDAGQQLLRAAIVADSQWTDIKLYTDLDGDKYYEPDSTTTPATYVSVTKFDEISYDKAGIVTFSATLKVSGIMKCNSTTSDPGVETLGSLDVADITATVIGELTEMGGEGTFDCYFEYGTTNTYGSDTKASETVKTAVGLFDNDLSGLSASTEYHFRAVIEETDSTKHYGKDQTFTTTA